MRLWLDAALSVLFAPECASCASPLAYPTEGAVCRECWQAIVPLTPPLCGRCGDALPSFSSQPTDCPRCLLHPPAYQQASAIGVYDGTLRNILHAIKYDGRRSLAEAVGQLMRTRAALLLSACEAAVPVPLHASKQRERGFNQAEDLARALGLPVVKALRRTRRTQAQSELHAGERIDNVRGAFAVNRRASSLVGRTVVLIDDVTTTGATLNECALALYRVGVATIYALTAARAVTKWH